MDLLGLETLDGVKRENLLFLSYVSEHQDWLSCQ